MYTPLVGGTVKLFGARTLMRPLRRSEKVFRPSLSALSDSVWFEWSDADQLDESLGHIAFWIGSEQVEEVVRRAWFEVRRDRVTEILRGVRDAVGWCGELHHKSF